MTHFIQQLPELLLPWYQEHKRDLPWRKDREPYHIWVSEIMLQQTRVEAVKGYYARFLDALPTIEALANCDDDLLHKLWEGLGYYSRVRNLKKAANVVMEQYGGTFPGTHEEIIKLRLRLRSCGSEQGTSVRPDGRSSPAASGYAPNHIPCWGLLRTCRP